MEVRSSRTISLVAVAVGVERRGAEDLGRAPAGVVLVLDLPAARPCRGGGCGRRCSGRRSGPGRRGRSRVRPAGRDAGERPEAAAGRRGGLAAGAAQQEQRRAEGVEDQDVGLAVAVDVERPGVPAGRRSSPFSGDLVLLAPAEGDERARLLALQGPQRERRRTAPSWSGRRRGPRATLSPSRSATSSATGSPLMGRGAGKVSRPSARTLRPICFSCSERT